MPSKSITIWFVSLFLLLAGCRYLHRFHQARSMVDGPEFVDGALVSREEATYSAVYAATTLALRELKIQLIAENKEKGTVSARTTDDKLVSIEIKRDASRAEIRIRISNEPEQARARLILEQIRKHY